MTTGHQNVHTCMQIFILKRQRPLSRWLRIKNKQKKPKQELKCNQETTPSLLQQLPPERPTNTYNRVSPVRNSIFTSARARLRHSTHKVGKLRGGRQQRTVRSRSGNVLPDVLQAGGRTWSVLHAHAGSPAAGFCNHSSVLQPSPLRKDI